MAFFLIRFPFLIQKSSCPVSFFFRGISFFLCLFYIRFTDCALRQTRRFRMRQGTADRTGHSVCKTFCHSARLCAYQCLIHPVVFVLRLHSFLVTCHLTFLAALYFCLKVFTRLFVLFNLRKFPCKHSRELFFRLPVMYLRFLLFSSGCCQFLILRQTLLQTMQCAFFLFLFLLKGFFLFL